MKQRFPHAYRLYGLCLTSHVLLPCPELSRSGPDAIELFEGPASIFSEVSRNASRRQDGTDWFHHLRLPDGSDYLRWSGLFEFLITAKGQRIACHALNGVSLEAFQTYLLSQVLSFALVKQGIEPLHATVVEVNGQAAAFLGDCGYGKSSLGAAFLSSGHALLTDDLLVVTESDRRFIAHPGLPRIKLFPEVMKTLLGSWVAGVPMNPTTPKLVISLGPHQFSHRAAPLKAIYALGPPDVGSRGKSITVRSLSQRRACLRLIANTFNPVIAEEDRLARQFHWAARLASHVPVKLLSYPRNLVRLPEVIQAIKADLNS